MTENKDTLTKTMLKRIFHTGEKSAIFLDGANVHGTMKALDFEIDFSRLRDFFADQSDLLRAFYFTAVKPEGQHDNLRKLLDYLSHAGWTMVTKPMKYMGADGTIAKGNMDIEIAVEMFGYIAHVDHMILFTGDGDFRRLVEALQQNGKRVTVVSSRYPANNSLSAELARQADNFIDLMDLKNEIARTRVAA